MTCSTAQASIKTKDQEKGKKYKKNSSVYRDTKAKLDVSEGKITESERIEEGLDMVHYSCQGWGLIA